VSRDVDVVRADLAAHDGMAGSWDWAADHRFAVAVGDTEAAAFLERLLDRNAGGVAPRLMDAHDAYVGHITRRRVRALGALVRAGEAEAWWSGLGVGGRSFYGIGRVRTYQLTASAPKRQTATPVPRAERDVRA
jgi:hypothetical protein